jgi:hypothetical protein
VVANYKHSLGFEAAGSSQKKFGKKKRNAALRVGRDLIGDVSVSLIHRTYFDMALSATVEDDDDDDDENFVCDCVIHDILTDVVASGNLPVFPWPLLFSAVFVSRCGVVADTFWATWFRSP